jgi:hypothetical protein
VAAQPGHDKESEYHRGRPEHDGERVPEPSRGYVGEYLECVTERGSGGYLLDEPARPPVQRAPQERSWQADPAHEIASERCHAAGGNAIEAEDKNAEQEHENYW